MSITNLVHTQANQAARIRAGAADGSLTKPEAVKLAGQQLSTDKMIVSAKRDDGVVGVKERAEIRGQQAQSSADIFQARHDGQTRPAQTPDSAPAPAPASSTTSAERPRVERQERQADRISAGVENGSLTRPETARLVGYEVRTDVYMAKSKADDGQIGKVESAVIEKRQDATSKAIFHAKHDAQSQG